ncbi:MAG TPA: hypothetical protein DEH78_27440 [Solibacterales bacterium]|nr:hypothetical protein [Bryobacterales bacterium]
MVRFVLTLFLILVVPVFAQNGSDSPAGFSSAAAIAPRPAPDGFQWKSALAQSGLFLGIQHAYRFSDQPYTREAMRGPFLKDYWRSITGLRGWDDGDSVLANYVGHPMEGAVAGYIYVHNSPRSLRQEFGMNSAYWSSRLRAMGFAALYSTQYELGPLGEGALGNVGMTRGTKGAVDLVITPTLGMAWMVTEDALDKQLIERLESKTGNAYVKMILRTGLNPSRTFANLLRFRVPWYRDTRAGVFQRQAHGR